MRLPPVVKTSRLHREGLSGADVERLVRSGRYRRLGRGWLATPAAPLDVVTALGSGHRLTCVSAAAHHGLWVPPSRGIHAYRSRNVEEEAPVSLVLHRPEPRRWPDEEPVADLPLTLLHSVRCLGTADAAILFESAWNRRLIDQAGLVDVVRRLPVRARKPLARLRSVAESGTETRVRWWLEGLGVPVRPQVQLDDVGRVDLLVGRRWVIECDSVAHHTSRESYEDDRRRDLVLGRSAYLSTRLTWHQVFLTWEATQEALLEMLRRGDHLRNPSM